MSTVFVVDPCQSRDRPIPALVAGSERNLDAAPLTYAQYSNLLRSMRLDRSKHEDQPPAIAALLPSVSDISENYFW
jgi:hypothetical protein